MKELLRGLFHFNGSVAQASYLAGRGITRSLCVNMLHETLAGEGFAYWPSTRCIARKRGDKHGQ
jgi:hypothetical protein